jgi:hypothetical protein
VQSHFIRLTLKFYHQGPEGHSQRKHKGLLATKSQRHKVKLGCLFLTLLIRTLRGISLHSILSLRYKDSTNNSVCRRHPFGSPLFFLRFSSYITLFNALIINMYFVMFMHLFLIGCCFFRGFNGSFLLADFSRGDAFGTQIPQIHARLARMKTFTRRFHISQRCRYIHIPERSIE